MTRLNDTASPYLRLEPRTLPDALRAWAAGVPGVDHERVAELVTRLAGGNIVFFPVGVR